MPGTPEKGPEIRAKILDQTLEIPIQPSPPEPILYQKPYFLSELDFYTIRKPSTVLWTLAGTFTTFSLSNGLSRIIEYAKLDMSTDGYLGHFATDTEWKVIFTSLFFGIFAFILGLFFSIRRWRVIRKIRKHFKQNPMQGGFV